MSSIKTNRPISSTKQASTPIGAPLMIILGVLCLAAAPALIYAPTYFPQSAAQFDGALSQENEYSPWYSGEGEACTV